MKKLIYLLSICFAISVQNSFSQVCGCAGSDYASIDVTGWTVGQIGTITTCQWGGERSTIYNTVAGAVYRVSTCGASYDTQLEIYTTGCTWIAYNDDNGPACTGLNASVDFTSPGGNLYSRMSQYYCTSNATCVTVTIQLISLPGPPPPPPTPLVINADCASPQSVSGTINPTDGCAFRTGFDRMVQVNIPTTGNWTFSTCGGASFDTYLYLSTGVCTGLIAQNDDACGLQSTITVTGLAAGTYYVDVEGFSAPAAGTPFTLTVTGSCPVNPCVGDVTAPSFAGGLGGPDQQALINNAYMAGFTQPNLAQSFIPTQSTICGASILLNVNGAAPGDVTITLTSSLGGAALASGTVIGALDGQWAQATWPAVSVTPGVTYYLQFTGTNTAQGIAGDIANGYPSGQVYANAGYGSFPNYDYTFQTFGCNAAGCPTNISTTAAAGICTASVATTNPSPTDACGVTKLTWNLSGATTGSSPASGINYVGTQNFNSGVTTVTYTAADAANNSSTCSFTVTVTDGQNPTITCPSNISAGTSPGVCTASVATPNPTTGDNCSVTTLTWTLSGATSGSSSPTGINNVGTQTFNPGVTTVTYTAKDAANNSSVCSYTVTVTDAQSPTLTCPSNISTGASIGVCNASVATPNPTVADNCGLTTLTWSLSGATTGSSAPTGVNYVGTQTFNGGITNVTYTAVDAANNSSVCSFTVTVTDGENPTITCPSNISAGAAPGVCTASVATPNPTTGDNCNVTALTWALTGATSGTSSPTGINNLGTQTFNPGVTTVTYTVKDAANNSTVCSFTVTVNDTENPSISCPSNISTGASAGGCTASVATSNPTTNDNCAVTTLSWVLTGATSGSSSPTGINNVGTQTFNSGVTTVTYTVKDGANNSAVCSFTVTVTDNQSPVPNVGSLSTVSGQCIATVTAPTATDNCAGIITATTSDPTSYATQGTFVVNWTYTDGNGNTATQTQSVIVDDVTAPVPNIGSLPDATGGCNVTVTAPTATDNCAGTITATTINPTSYSVPGTYVINWTYDDGNGNISTQSQNVIVTSVGNPIADVDPLPVLSGQCNTNVVTTPTATDNCGGTVIGTTSDPLTYSTQGTFVINWMYDDGNGNSSTQQQTVVIDDTTAPVPDNASLSSATGSCSAAVVGTPTATDNCMGTITGTTSDPLTYSAVGTYTVTWVYNDGNGNTSTQTQTVTVTDNVAPVPVNPSLPTITGVCSASLTNPPIATDNCVGTVIGTTADPLTYNTDGTFIVTWVYDDGNGNTSTQTQTVIVDDVTAPVPDVAPLPAITAICTIVIDNIPTATDNCEGVLAGTTSDPLSYGVGTFTITWVYNDGNGNSSTQTQTVIVSPCAGIDESTDNWGVQIYPNPSEGIFTVSIGEMPKDNLKVKLINTAGQVIYAGILTTQTQMFDFSYLAAGTYYLQMVAGDDLVTKKIIIKSSR